MKIESVIMLGPSTELYPLVTGSNPKFALPFMNIPLLNHTINYLAQYSMKIYILCLKQHKHQVDCLIRQYNLKIQVVESQGYEGMAHHFAFLKKNIVSSYFIFCKADLYYFDPLNEMIERFIISKDDMHASVYKSQNKDSIMCINSADNLLAYNSEEIPYSYASKIQLTNSFSLKNFYICKSSLLDSFEPSCFGFKNNFIPFLIKKGKKIKLCLNHNFQIKSINDYIKQLDFKNIVLKGGSRNYIDGDEDKMMNLKHVTDSIISNADHISISAKIDRSVIMENVIIEAECIIHKCIIASNVRIGKGCVLNNCKVGPGFIIPNYLIATSQCFSLD